MGNGRKMWLLIFKIVLSLVLVNNVHGQGRMLTPAGRSSLWRDGYDTPINDNDNILNCGGNKVSIVNFITITLTTVSEISQTY